MSTRSPTILTGILDSNLTCSRATLVYFGAGAAGYLNGLSEASSKLGLT
jgi:hypothetical protein